MAASGCCSTGRPRTLATLSGFGEVEAEGDGDWVLRWVRWLERL